MPGGERLCWKTLCTLDLACAPEAAVTLEGVGSLRVLPPERDAVLECIGEYDAYLASAAIRVDETFLKNARRLKLIGSPHTGTDHLDLAGIERRQIRLFHIAHERELLESFSATSELAFGLILSLVRRIGPASAVVATGHWPRERYTGFQLLGKTLGILGLGRLGRISARIGHGFGMRVLAHDIADIRVPDVAMVDFDTLLRDSDIISIHVHLNEETRGLINADALAKMKPGAVLINTSRGAIVDEEALLDALASGRLLGAGLDVIDGEWLSQADRTEHPLVAFARAHENLLITPHIGGATTESIAGARTFMAKKMAAFVRDVTPTRID